MSQQGMTIVSALLANIIKVIQEMGDLEYLSKKEFDGKARFAKGQLTNNITGDLASLTANTGKDMYIAKATVNLKSDGAAGEVTANLVINGVIVETYEQVFNDNNSTGMAWYEFKNIGQKVAAGQIIKLEVTFNAVMVINGVIKCFEEDTGADPTILASSITVDASLSSTGLLAGDTAFLAKKEFDGKIRSDNRELVNVAGDLASLTANIGKDMYLARAQITSRIDTTVAASAVPNIELSLNGVVIETTAGIVLNIASTTIIYEFKNIGQKVAAGQIIKLELLTTDLDLRVTGFIECWEEDTGADPLG